MLRLKENIILLTIAVLPLLLSVLASIKESIIIMILVIIALLFAVLFLPFTNRYENIWMFLLVAVSGIPLNVMMIKKIIGSYFVGSDIFVIQVMRWLLLYIMIFCAEEVVLGFLTSLIWRKQKKIL